MAFERMKVALSNASFICMTLDCSVRETPRKEPVSEWSSWFPEEDPLPLALSLVRTPEHKPRPIRCGSRFWACLICWLPSSPFLWELSTPAEEGRLWTAAADGLRLPSILRIYFALEKSSSILEGQPLPPLQLHPGPAGQLPKIKVSAALGQRLGGVSI